MPKTLFDHVNAIYTDQTPGYFDALNDGDKKTFSPYMVNRVISMNADSIPIVNEFQKYLNLVGSRETYLFYSQLLPKGKRYDKYIKATKSEKYEKWVVELLSAYFGVSLAEAENYCGIFYSSESGKAELRIILERHGIDPKQIKKAKL
jgi:hypothetical protein